MKPCRQFKERIALSIAEAKSDAALQEHLRECAACRAYAEEIRAVCGDHAQRASQLPEIDAPLRLHGKLRDALQEKGRSWTWIRPIATGALATLAFFLYLHWRPPPKENQVVTVPRRREIKVTEPSYAAYRHRLSHSADELEAALSRYDAPGQGDNQMLKASSRSRELN
jgi:hypothetical protein